MSYAIDILNVTRAFGSRTALDDITLRVAEHSICGLLGRNGAGKTTIMSILAGQDRPTSGRVEVFGRRPFENDAVLAKVSFIRDNQRYPDRYCLEHVLRIAPVFAANWSEDLAEELVDGFRIPAKTPIKRFSRGQLSSVAILLGLASRAPLTLFDEPYLGLDVTARAFFHDALLRDYSAHPRTFVLSTHLIEESEALFDQVVILDAGRIRVNASIDDSHECAFTARGNSDAVDHIARGYPVLQTHAIGALKSVVIEGAPDDEVLAQAHQLGVSVGTPSLQELVAAYGADTSPVTPRAISKGTRA
ncbi:MAG: ABC transporter ATP-binding protein [Acidobacteria bacterium]|nr:ABC transporter ATP-binding protein [Acidobacteriota bacterium]